MSRSPYGYISFPSFAEDSSLIQPSYTNPHDLQASFALHFSSSPLNENTKAKITFRHDNDIAASSKTSQIEPTSTSVTSPKVVDAYPPSHRLHAWMEQDILEKLLDKGEIQRLVARGYGQMVESSTQDGTGTLTNRTLQSVHIVGVSPSFAAGSFG